MSPSAIVTSRALDAPVTSRRAGSRKLSISSIRCTGLAVGIVGPGCQRAPANPCRSTAVWTFGFVSTVVYTRQLNGLTGSISRTRRPVPLVTSCACQARPVQAAVLMRKTAPASAWNQTTNGRPFHC